jgi:exopolyphosphatase
MRLPAASALASFLAGPTVQLPRAVVCIGNDAGDIDSLASALGLAVVLQQRQPDALYVPCAPFARRDFRLRQDASLLFGHCASLDDAGAPAELMHLDDLGGGAASWRDADSLTVALTDHNVCLPGVTEAVGGAPVAAIVDHHNDEAKHVDTAALREVDPAVGSCCSLIVEMADAATLGGALGVLLLGAIAIDTRGFDPTLLGTKYNGRYLTLALTLTLTPTLTPTLMSSPNPHQVQRARPNPHPNLDPNPIPNPYE